MEYGRICPPVTSTDDYHVTHGNAQIRCTVDLRVGDNGYRYSQQGRFYNGAGGSPIQKSGPKPNELHHADILTEV